MYFNQSNFIRQSFILYTLSSNLVTGLLRKKDFSFETESYNAADYQNVNASGLSIPLHKFTMPRSGSSYWNSDYTANVPVFTVDLGKDKLISKVMLISSMSLESVTSINISSSSKNFMIILSAHTKPNYYNAVFLIGGVKARYVHFLKPGSYNNLRILVYVVRMEVHRERLSGEKTLASSHPFGTENMGSLVLSIATYLDPGVNRDFIGYDGMPMAWALIKLKHFSYVTSFAESSWSQGYPDIVLAYRLDDTREFVYYKEGMNAKVFRRQLVFLLPGKQKDYYKHKLLSPFMANAIKVYLMYRLPSFTYYRVDVHGYPASPFSSAGQITCFEKFKRPVASHLTVDMKENFQVSGIKLHRKDVIQTFTLEYTNTNSEVVLYSDDPYSNLPTIFLGSSSGWISLRSFATSVVKVASIKWEEDIPVSSLVVFIRGNKYNVPSHQWTSSERIYMDDKDESTNIFAFLDTYNGLTLYGNMNNFHKISSDERLTSSYIGPDCLSRPSTCENGFTIGFQVYGKLLFDKTVNDLTIPSKTTYKYPSGKKFQQMTFTSPNFYSPLVIKHANLKFRSDIVDFGSDFGVLVSDTPTGINDLMNSYTPNLELLATIEVVDGFRVIDITVQLDQYFQNRIKATKSIYIAITTTLSLSNVKLDVLLSMTYHYKVPKTLLNIPNDLSTRWDTVTGFEQRQDGQRVCVDNQNFDWIIFSPTFFTDWFRPASQLLLYKTLDKPIKGFLHKNGEKSFIHAGKIDGGEEILPIISCGIHGNITLNQGTGFSIFYQSTGIYGVVKTEYEHYSVELPLDNFQDNKWNTVFLRWDKLNQMLTLKVNEYSNEDTSPAISVNVSSHFIYEYLLLFGQYHGKHAYAHGIYKNFSIWRYPIEDSLMNELRSENEIVYPFTSDSVCTNCQLTPGCFCMNVVCPCNSSSVGSKIELSYDLTRFTIIEIGESRVLQKKGVHFYNHNMKEDKAVLYFDGVDEDFNKIFVQDVKLQITLKEPAADILKLKIYNFKESHESVLIVVHKSKQNGTSGNLVKAFYKQIYTRKSNGIIFSTDKSSLPELLSANLILEGTIVNQEPGIVAFAHIEDSSIWNIPLPVKTACIKFKYKFQGQGFAYLSVRDVHGDFVILEELARIYLNEKQDVETEIEISNPDEQMREMRFILTRNGLGDGYFTFFSLRFLQEKCTKALNDLQKAELGKNLDKILSEKNYPRQILFANPFDNQLEAKRTRNLFSIHHIPYFSITSTYLLQKQVKLEKFSTMSFWLKDDSTQINSYQRIIYIPYDNDDGRYISFGLYGGKMLFHTDRGGSSLRTDVLDVSKWYFVTISIYEDKILMTVGSSNIWYVKEEIGRLGCDLPSNIINKNLAVYVHYYTDRVVMCFQYTKSVDTKDIHLFKLCPTEHTTLPCQGTTSENCGRCDQLLGKWITAFGSDYYDFQCKKVFQMDSVYTHLTFESTFRKMDTIENAKSDFKGIHRNDIGFADGVYVNGISFTAKTLAKKKLSSDIFASKVFFSAWIRHQCLRETAIVTAKLFKLECIGESSEDNFANVFLTTKICRYLVPVKAGLWYHIVIEINIDDNTVQVFVDGLRLNLTSDCNYKYEDDVDELSIWSTSDERIYIDEVVLNEVNPFQSLSFYDLVHNNYLKRPKYDEGLPHAYVKFTIKTIAWRKEMNVLGSFFRKEVIDYIKSVVSKATQNEFDVDESSASIENVNDCGSETATQILMKIFVKGYLDYVRITKINTNDVLCKIEDITSQTDYAEKLDAFKNQDIQKLDEGKTYLTFRWNNIDPNMFLKGVLIAAVYKGFFGNESIQLHEMSFNTDFMMLTNLESFTEYHNICFYPVHYFSIDAHVSGSKCLSGSLKTAEAEPIEKPLLLCNVKSRDQIECVVKKIDDRNFKGEKYSYRVYSVETLNATNLHLDVDQWNLTNFDLQETPISDSNLVDYVFTINTPITFWLYTIVAMATTQNGDGLGARTNITMRSHIGVPEETPWLSNVSTIVKGTISFYWKAIGEDLEIWNSYNQSLWQYVLKTEIYDDFQKLNESSGYFENLTFFNTSSYGLDITQTIQYDEYYHLFCVSIAARNELYTTIYNNTLSVLIDSLAPIYYAVDGVYINNISDGSVLHSKNISMNSFDLQYWRGNRYYYIFAYAHDKAKETNVTKIVSSKSYKNKDYWLKIVRKQFALKFEINQYMGYGKKLNTTDFSKYISQNSSQSAVIRDLHPATVYNLTVFACNEISCDLNNYGSTSFETPAYKPGRGPENILFVNSSSTSMVLTYGLIDEFYQHGVILGYHIELTSSALNISKFVNETNVTSVVEFDGLQKYRECCIRIAGFTSYHELGNYSALVCNKTGEDLPTSFPSNFKLANKTSTCLYFSWGIIDPAHQNGIILDYIITIWNETTSMILQTPHLSLGICNLKKYNEYTVMIQGRTSIGVGVNSTIHNRTDEDIPCAPKNMTAKAYFTDYIIVEWEGIPSTCQNGIILGFVIFNVDVEEYSQGGDAMIYHQENISDPSSRETRLKSVKAGSVYNITIAGTTSKGVGDRTPQVIVRLGEKVNGNWSEWTKWSPCSASCGFAISTRSRDCNNPPPKDGGSNCTGNDFNSFVCDTVPCSGYRLAPPGDYDCSLYCARNKMFCSQYYDVEFSLLLKDLKLQCDDKSIPIWKSAIQPGIINENNVIQCIGFQNYPNKTTCSLESDASETKYQRICKCIHKSDIGFTPWGQWSICTITCGDSQRRTRKRICSAEGQCSGKTSQQSECVGIKPCPIDGGWSGWTDFEPCNKSCGYGYENRRRFCNNPIPLYGGEKCRGVRLHSIGGCNAHYCPVHGNWNEWSEWTACDTPCGSSNQTRTRECNNPSPDFKGNDCFGNKTESKECLPQPPCIPNAVRYVFEFVKKKFVYTLNYMHHPDTVNLTRTLCAYHEEISLKNTHIIDCIVKSYRKGSVIVSMDVWYKYVHEDQIVHMFDTINHTRKFIHSQLGYFSINSSTVPCPPPSNIRIKEMKGGKVEFSYDVEVCYDGTVPVQIYVFYIDNALHSQENAWKWNGVFVRDNLNITLHNLIPFKVYRARLVQSNFFGNGNPSHAVYFSSFAGPPLRSPPDLRYIAISSDTIYIDWSDVPVEYRNGQLLGYRVWYKYYLGDSYQEKVVSFGYKSITLENLKAFTLYAIEVCAFNQGGEGPRDVAVVKTLEGVPSIPVPGVAVDNYQAIDWWSIHWKSIPDEFVNGILLGYRVRYYLAYKSSKAIGGQKIYVVHETDIFTLNYKATGLESYGTYNVTVTGFTSAGEGPAPEYSADTCRCPRHLFSHWYINPPYVKMSEDGKLEGIFPDLIHRMVIQACGSCKQYSQSELHFYTTRTGLSPDTKTEEMLKKRISDEVDVSLPLYGRKEIKAIVPNSVFISMISSPGCAMIIRNETDVQGILNSMIMGVVSVWPMLLVSYAIATLFGILVWFTDQTENPDEFNIGSSLIGPVIGFWFSFVTMTTVGYGDITPRSTLARAISMVWFLVGLVLNGIVVGFITSAVTSINIVEEHSLYNTLTGAINNTFEQRYSIMRNAKVSDEAYANVDDVLDALSSSKVDAALIDIYAMASYKPILKEKKLKVVRLIDARTGYGFALSGSAQVLKLDIESLVLENQNVIGDFVASLEGSIPGLSKQEAGAASADIFSASSPAFIASCKYMGFTILALSVMGILFNCVQFIRKRRKVGVAKTEYEIVVESCDELLEICERLDKNITDVSDEFNKELAQLAVFHWAYKHKVSLVGKVGADNMIYDSSTKERNNWISD